MSIIPNHVAIIPDGNRRWAKEKNKNPLEGHRAGAFAIRKMISQLQKHGVHTITIWIFSTENWKRVGDQVSGLFNLFESFADNYFKDAIDSKTRIIHLGRKDRLPKTLKAKIDKIETATKKFTGKILNVALDYGGRDEIIRALKKIQEQNIDVANWDEANFAEHLDTQDQPHPEPDMIIRSGGERRSSGFMIWQGAYSEYFFIDKYLPDVVEEDIDKLLDEYKERKRRFGK